MVSPDGGGAHVKVGRRAESSPACGVGCVHGGRVGGRGALAEGGAGGRCVECRPPTHRAAWPHRDGATCRREMLLLPVLRAGPAWQDVCPVSYATSQGSHFPRAARTLDLWAELGGKRAAFPRFSAPPPHCSPCLGGATLLTCTSPFSVGGWSGPSFQSPKGRRRRRQPRSLPGWPPASSGAGPAAVGSSSLCPGPCSGCPRPRSWPLLLSWLVGHRVWVTGEKRPSLDPGRKQDPPSRPPCSSFLANWAGLRAG